tara:strand:+ start:1103 stop:1978 length:876 start_codon:yes stop_codon:yes gene_type:complete
MSPTRLEDAGITLYSKSADLNDLIVRHYQKGDLFDRIKKALNAAGKNLDALTPDDLKAVDEFHIGGVQATTDLLDQLKVGPETNVIDIGSGLGGPARHIASHYGANVTGIDLTPEYVDTASHLTTLTNLNIKFHVGSALSLPVDDGKFDLATLIHVGMNLPDKVKLFSEAYRVLRPGGCFAVYDVMRVGEGHPDFPVPWASTLDGSFLDTPENYRAAAKAAGFVLHDERARAIFALEFFENLKAVPPESDPPPVGLHLVMGPDAPTKIGNMVKAIKGGHVAPVEMIFKKSL